MLKKLKIGVTGGLASGKSTVCKIFESGGYPVIYADDVAKELLQSDKSIKEKIIAEFGKESFQNDLPNRKFLAEKVFSDPQKLRKINSIIHPPTMKKIESMMNDFLKENNIVFVESAIIFEAELENYFDNVLLVASPDDKKIERVVESGRMSKKDAEKRLANQLPDSEKKELADFVIQNNKSLVELKINAEFFLKIFERMIASAS